MSTATETPVRTWSLDPARSVVEFTTRGFWGLAAVTGRFSRFEGSYSTGPDGAEIELDVDARTLDTGNRLRDKHLRSEDFFAAEEHPRVRFSSSHVAPTGDGAIHVQGELEAAGQRVPLEFFAAERALGAELEIEATTELDHHLVGMTHSPLGMVRRPSTLHVRAQLVPTA